MTTRLPCSWSKLDTRCRLRKQLLSRYLSSSAPETAKADNKAFSQTLLLPKTPFKLRPDLKEVQDKYGKLTTEELYRWQWENAQGPLWVLHDGPPYANGDLHMGHALNKVIKDIINRFQLLQGRKVHYVPGWDCHGLPIENKAMKDMGRDPLDTPAEVIREAAEATALREIDSQREQFRPLAVMADWYSKDNTYRTLDRHYEMRQLRVFQTMVANGLIYRQHRPVHYSPSSRSALAEAELEYKEDHVSHSVYVKFDIDEASIPTRHVLRVLLGSGVTPKLLVWTTTPWTLSANMGIAVHKELLYDVVKLQDGSQDVYIVGHDRLDALGKFLGEVEVLGSVTGEQLAGLSYQPLFSGSPQSLPIIHAIHVTSLSGTGLVHCAPAHGVEDYNAFRALGLSTTDIVCHVDSKGQFSKDVATVVGEEHASSIVGQDVLGGGNKAMVILLKSLDKVVKVERIKHKYPYDWKTKEPIIVTATSQWFANLDAIKNDALDALKAVEFFPKVSRNRLEAFIQSRSEWCISRQRVWGVPIPALHHLHSDRVVLDERSLDFILNAIESKNLDWWTSPIEEFVPPWLLEPGQSASETWAKGRDTMDVWFDSGSSWSMLPEMGVGRNPDAGRLFDADLCLEGSDQHRGWFQSQLLTAVASGNKSSPYGTLLTHGMVLDEKGKKMSKSLGNIISPMDIVNGGKKGPAHGTDVLRLWTATVEYWKDMSIGPTIISQAVESLRKIRNTARFCLGNIGDEQPKHRVPKERMGLVERYVMNELYNLEQTALEGYKTYNFPKVMNSLNNFANITMSSLYFDITKDNLYANSLSSEERSAVTTVLEHVLDTMSKVLAPILPYLAEEIHSTRRNDGKSIFMTPWTQLDKQWCDPQASEDMTRLLYVRSAVLSSLEVVRGKKYIKSSLEAEVDIILPGESSNSRLIELLQREEYFLKTFFIVSDASVIDEGSLGSSSSEWTHTQTLSVPDSDDMDDIAIRIRPAQRQKCPRCWTFTREEDHALCHRCTDVLKADHTH